MVTKTSKTSSNRTKKEVLIATLKQKFTDAKSVALTDYRGLTMLQLQEFRKAIKPIGGEYLVAKNTLLVRALPLRSPERQSKGEGGNLTGPTAVLFSYQDESASLKTLVEFAKKHQLPTLKFGFLGSALLSAEELQKFASLPTKLELQGKLVSVLASPMAGMVNVLQANIRNLVVTLEAIRKQKGGE